jgi:hypothetical protein
MSSDLEKALARAKYVALPLPRANTGPTAILTFSDGFLHIVRNEHSCVPDPPVAVTNDPSVDVLAFQRKFSFSAKGLLEFFYKIFGQSNVRLEARQIRSATVELGGLSHVTIESGAFVDYLLTLDPTTPCYRDLVDKRNLTIVAALRAGTFAYTFQNQAGATVEFTLPEATQMFKTDVSVDVQIDRGGTVRVTSPQYVGMITWDGTKIQKELERARRARLGIRLTGQPYRAADPVDYALTPEEVLSLRLRSMGIPPKRKKGR